MGHSSGIGHTHVVIQMSLIINEDNKECFGVMFELM